MIGQPLFDGTFSTEAVAAAGHALVDRLHAEAMATIADLAENWDSPAADTATAEDGDPVTFEDPATWSVDDDEDDSEDDDDVRLLQPFEFPALLPRPRPATAVEVRAEDAVATDQFAVPTVAA